MKLLKMIYYLPRVIHEAIHFDFNLKDEKLHELARSSYQLCTEWFGVPVDHAQGYKLIYGVRNRCIKPFASFTGPYLVALKKGYNEEQYASVIAHEIYHRVTIKRLGIHHPWWVDEMIAYAVERHAVPELGYAEYAQMMHKRFIESPGNFDARMIKEITSSGISPGMDRKACELQLDYSIVALGAQLEAIVEWHDICKIVGSPTWKDWLDDLTPDVQEKVVALLDL